MSVQAEVGGAEPRVMLGRVADALCVGGLALLVFVPLLATDGDALERLLATDLWLAMALLNWPHFMASYWLLYSSRELVKRHPWAAIRFPALLGLYAVAAVMMAPLSLVPIKLMLTASAAYLAWHYTGQAWGMIASYGFLSGAAPDARERRLLRLNLDILLALHVSWVAYRLPLQQLPQAALDALAWIHTACAWGAGLAPLLGVAGWAAYWKRTGRVPPVNSLLPWLAVHAWYALLLRNPGALTLIQLAHALQYLVFPLRVAMNRRLQQPGGDGRAAVWAGARVAILLLVSGVVFLWLVPHGVAQAMVAAGWPTQAEQVMAVALAFVNIHHYFTDGCTWKIGQPEVRRDLFFHVKPA